MSGYIVRDLFWKRGLSSKLSLSLGFFVALALLASTAPCRAQASFSFLEDKLPAQSLLEQLEGQKAVLPQGITLRPVNARGIALTESSEGFIDHLYNDSAHYCTIGYGHLIKKAPCDGSEPHMYQGIISQATARQWLVQDMAQAQIAVMTNVTTELTDDQYAALCDLVFNIGGGNFKRSTLLQVINAKQLDRVPSQFQRWAMAGGKTWPGLVKRRDHEIALFFYGQPIPKGVPIPGEDLSPLDIFARS